MRTVLVLLVAVSLASCSSKEQSKADELKLAVASTMKDPESVQYRNLKMGNVLNGTLCGEVNAKNSFGAYAGFEKFSLNNPQSLFLESRLQKNVDSFGDVSDSIFVKALEDFQKEWSECQSQGVSVD